MSKTANLGDTVRSDAVEYAAATHERMTPLLTDGCLPINRRALQACYDVGGIVTSSRIVGHILGAYHPHGDISAYGSCCRMSREEAFPAAPITFVGNNGSADEAAAAQRYTEFGLSKIGKSVYIDEDLLPYADHIPNFDETGREIRALPTNLPTALLTNLNISMVGHSFRFVSAKPSEVHALTLDYMKLRANTVGSKKVISDGKINNLIAKHISGPELGHALNLYYHGTTHLVDWLNGVKTSFDTIPTIEMRYDKKDPRSFKIIIADSTNTSAKMKRLLVEASHPYVLQEITDAGLYKNKETGYDYPVFVITATLGGKGTRSPIFILNAIESIFQNKIWSFPRFNRMVDGENKIVLASLKMLLEDWFDYRMLVEVRFLNQRRVDTTRKILEMAALKVMSNNEFQPQIMKLIRAKSVEQTFSMQKLTAEVLTCKDKGVLLAEHIYSLIDSFKMELGEREIRGMIPDCITRILDFKLLQFRWTDVRANQLKSLLKDYFEIVSLLSNEEKRILAVVDRITGIGKLFSPKKTICRDSSNMIINFSENMLWFDGALTVDLPEKYFKKPKSCKLFVPSSDSRLIVTTTDGRERIIVFGKMKPLTFLKSDIEIASIRVE